MSTISIPLVFRVGRGIGKPGSVGLDFAFRVGEGTGQPATVSYSLAFGVEGLGKPAVVSLSLAFEIKGPDATIFLYEGDSLGIKPRPVLVWTGSEFYPPI